MVLTVVGSTISTIPLQSLYSSSAQETRDKDQQGGSAGVEEVDDELMDEPEPAPLADPEPEPDPATEPVDDTEPGSLDDGNLIEREKECPKGEYDNGGKCPR